jgi:hypothetical protein
MRNGLAILSGFLCWLIGWSVIYAVTVLLSASKWIPVPESVVGAAFYGFIPSAVGLYLSQLVQHRIAPTSSLVRLQCFTVVVILVYCGLPVFFAPNLTWAVVNFTAIAASCAAAIWFVSATPSHARLT